MRWITIGCAVLIGWSCGRTIPPGLCGAEGCGTDAICVAGQCLSRCSHTDDCGAGLECRKSACQLMATGDGTWGDGDSPNGDGAGDASGGGCVTAYRDVDNDGFTLGAETVCEDPLPVGYRLNANPPPVASFEASQSANADTGSSWGNTSDAQTRGNGSAGTELEGGLSRALVMTGFDLAVPTDSNVLGVEVFIRRRSEEGTVVDELVSLVVDGAVSGDNKAVTDTSWGGWSTQIYGGADDTWGMALTPAIVNAADFGAALRANNTVGDESDIDVDHVWLRVFIDRGEDCNDADDEIFSSLTAYEDDDGDRYTVGPVQDLCAGDIVPTGFNQRSLGTDCYDFNSNVRPGQTRYFTSHRGDNSFDYDCDTNTTTEGMSEHESCNCSPGCWPVSVAGFTPTAACGDDNTVNLCAGICPTCTLQPTLIPTACR